MKQIKNIAKKVLPKRAWNFLRHYRGLTRDWIANRGAKVCRIEYCGYLLCYSPGTILIDKVRNGKIFEEKMCRSIVSELAKAPKPVFLDVGANIGLISLYVAANVPRATVYAFEPGPHQNKFFGLTVAANNLAARIALSDKALGNKEGAAAFMSHFSPDCSGDGFVDTGRAGEPIPVEVQVTTLDRWWSDAGRPHIGVMKVDIEGAELWALQGAVEFLKQAKPTLFLEIEPKNLRVYPYTRDDILAWLRNHGYDLYTLDNERCGPDNWRSFEGRYDTYVARPRLS